MSSSVESLPQFFGVFVCLLLIQQAPSAPPTALLRNHGGII